MIYPFSRAYNPDIFHLAIFLPRSRHVCLVETFPNIAVNRLQTMTPTRINDSHDRPFMQTCNRDPESRHLSLPQYQITPP